VPITFPALTGRRIRVTFTGVRLEYSSNYYATASIALPLGVAEVGIPGLHAPPDPTTVPGYCQSNLLRIDGQPISVRVTGLTATALDNGTLAVSLCGPDAAGIHLSAGSHLLQTAVAHVPSTVTCPATATCNGWNINQLTLDSAPGGAAEPVTANGSVPAPHPGPAPSITTDGQSATSQRVTVRGATGPFELVLGQSVNAGWEAVAEPAPGAPPGARAVNLGPSELVDSFANGWPVTAADLAALGVSAAHPSFAVALTWFPQRTVNLAIGISAVTVAGCVVVGFLPERWRRALRPRRRPRAARPVRGRGVAGTSYVLAAGEGGAARLPVITVGDSQPELALPGSRRGHRPPWWAIPLIALVAGLVAAAVSSPLIGLAAGFAVAMGLAVPQVRAVTSAVAVGLLIAAALSVTLGQAMHPVPESSNWPNSYESAAVLVWMAAVFLGADAVVEAGRDVAIRRRSTRAAAARNRTAPPDVPAAPAPDHTAPAPTPPAPAAPAGASPTP
jgi:hypothetical protein